MRTHNPNVLICSLRKPCEHCGQPYGRKQRKRDHDNYPYLESINQFERSRFCSEKCKSAALGLASKANAEAKRRKEHINRVILPAAQALFIYGIRVSGDPDV